MIIDGRNFNFNFNPFGTNQLMYRAKSEKEAEALRKLMSDSEKSVSIIQDLQPKGTIPNFDGFQTNFGTVNNPTNIGNGIKEVVWLNPFEQEYTADNALNNNWFSSTTSSIFNGYRSGATVKDDAVVGMDKQQFLTYVRENGLDKEINWNSVSNSFIGSYSFEKFSDYTNYSAALYASLENRIMNDFTGDEQIQQLEMLNLTFEQAINNTVQFYTGEVNYTFEKLGMKAPEEELEQGIRAVMMSKKDLYSEFIKNNSDYANLAESEDKWLERDVGYMANALRNAFKPSEIKTISDYNENDVIAAGMMAKMYLHDALDNGMSSALDYNDEESVGLAISMNYLMLASFMDDFGVGDGVRKFGEELFEKYTQSVISRENRGLELSRNRPLGASSSAFSPLKYEDIHAILNKMISTYNETKDASKAIHETTSFAYNQFKNKENNTEYNTLWRYNSPVAGALKGKDFWNNLYDNGVGSSFMGKIIDKWNGFAESVNKKDLLALSKKANTLLFHTYRAWTFYEKPIVGGN